MLKNSLVLGSVFESLQSCELLLQELSDRVPDEET